MRLSVDTVERYLETRPYQLWGTWSIIDPKQRKVAAEWFMTELNNMFSVQLPAPTGQPVEMEVPNGSS